MSVQMQFSETELGLVTELLQMELDELPQELHHSRAPNVRDALRHREELVRQLLARLQATGTPH
jgi:FtsZ-binding cell division protein ZapB